MSELYREQTTMSIKIEYYFDEDFLKTSGWVARHEKISDILQSLKQSSKIADFDIREHKEPFPTQEEKPRWPPENRPVVAGSKPASGRTVFS